MTIFDMYARRIAQILDQKNREYGDENLVKHGLLGIYIRLSDKLSRLKHQMFENGKVEDTLIDIAGYAINALRLLDEKRLTMFGELAPYVKGGEDDVESAEKLSGGDSA